MADKAALIADDKVAEQARLGANLARNKKRKECLANAKERELAYQANKKRMEPELAFLDELTLDNSEAKNEPSLFTVSHPNSPAFNRKPKTEVQLRADAVTDNEDDDNEDDDEERGAKDKADDRGPKDKADDSSVHSPHTPSDVGDGYSSDEY